MGMSERKYVVPEGMLEAAVEAVKDRSSDFGFSFLDNKDKERIVAQTRDTLEAALRWWSEHADSLVTSEVVRKAARDAFLTDNGWGETAVSNAQSHFISAIRRMFLAPEPEVPDAVADLMWHGVVSSANKGDRDRHNDYILEAFERGQRSGYADGYAERSRETFG